ncbi:type II and III secretion system protein [Methylomarinum sp. Ch1-1]|uniref:Type II and III secretion system protein n=1 Tax=Methylomarinum roseum TaxID=3067653 RepID=A0AAU7NU14_9GAMM|nr:type II and III secretion system protein [Methylomarinum sp. Ch1-1]MDP4519494.1 type II and III secretion system protein [Methylomarinum sp. Ch1-1]
MPKRFIKAILAGLLLLASPLPHAEQRILEVIPLQHRPAAELQPLISPLLEGSDRIIANGDSLIVRTTVDRLPTIQALIKKLDAALTNLIITVIQSQHKTARELNAEAAISIHMPLDQPHQSGGKMRGLAGSTEGFKNDKHTQVIRTLEGRPAHIETGNIQPLTDISIYDTGYGYPSVTSNTRLIEASSGFAVLPRLSGHYVTLEIWPWTDEMDRPGIIATQSAHTTLRVKLGKWVEIGSINQDSESQQRGFLSHRRTTEQQAVRILLKVEKTN